MSRILELKVKPNARTSLLIEQAGGTWVAQVSIRAGAGGRRKLVKIEDWSTRAPGTSATPAAAGR